MTVFHVDAIPTLLLSGRLEVDGKLETTVKKEGRKKIRVEQKTPRSTHCREKQMKSFISSIRGNFLLTLSKKAVAVLSVGESSNSCKRRSMPHSTSHFSSVNQP